MNKDVKKLVLDTFDEIDEIMREYGFKRRRNGLIYSRTIGNTKQRIELVFQTHPLGKPDALVRIYPWLSVHFPEVNQFATAVLGENIIIDSLKNLTLRQPIQTGKEYERWFIYNESDIKTISLKIKEYFIKNTIPFLNSLKNIEQYIRMYEMKDKRLWMDDRQYIYFACTYALKKEYQKGYDLLEKRFGKAGSRRTYQKLFEYFEQRL